MWTRKIGDRDRRGQASKSAVSVTATVLNEVGDIDRLVAALWSKLFSPAEVVIVDGGSTDGTWEHLQAAGLRYPNLIAIRDETCSLKGFAWTDRAAAAISADRSASSELLPASIADAPMIQHGSRSSLRPILDGRAEYAVGGSCIDPQDRTTWDIASAPFFGIKLGADEPTKSCTAAPWPFANSYGSKWADSPRTFSSVKIPFSICGAQNSDASFRGPGQSTLSAETHVSVRDSARLQAMRRRTACWERATRACFAILRAAWPRCLALALLPLTVIPLLCILALETYFAFRLDWRSFPGKFSLRQLGARLAVLAVVPWVVTWNQIDGHAYQDQQS